MVYEISISPKKPKYSGHHVGLVIMTCFQIQVVVLRAAIFSEYQVATVFLSATRNLEEKIIIIAINFNMVAMKWIHPHVIIDLS